MTVSEENLPESFREIEINKHYRFKMNRIISVIAVCLLSLPAFGQAQITTKKMKLEDFPEKITKIVLPGDMFLDSMIEEEVKSHWTISPYEFCSLEEFESLKSNADYYFLLIVSGQFRRESTPGIQMFSLVKGGSGADRGIDDMLEVVSLPFRSASYPSGREFSFISAFIDIIQAHVIASMKTDIHAYSGLTNFTLNMAKAEGMKIFFAESDISETLRTEMQEQYHAGYMEVISDDEADAKMDEKAEGSLIAYTVAPYDAKPGSYCYKMLIDSKSHTLYYYKRHKISKRYGAGFLPEDLQQIAEL